MSIAKGEWIINRSGDLFSVATHDEPICDFWQLEEETHNIIVYENAETNAELIAAAPKTKQQRDDLLAACKATKAILQDIASRHIHGSFRRNRVYSDGYEGIDILEVEIAKAEKQGTLP